MHDRPSAAEIARALGGKRSGNGNWSCHCPNRLAHPRGDRKPSLSIRDGDSGFPIFYCFNPDCRFEDVVAELEARDLFSPQQWGRERPVFHSQRRKDYDRAAAARSDEGMHFFAQRIWAHAVDPRGTAAEDYLVRRGLTLPDEIAGRVVRFHRDCAFGPGRPSRPCLILPFRPIDAADDEAPPVAIHRIALVPGAADEPRKMMLGPVKGAVIKLSPSDAVTTGLGVAEGFEKALALYLAGWRPLWTPGSGSLLEVMPILAGVEHLTIFADSDEPGFRSAERCAARWSFAADVEIRAPRAAGVDWDDEIEEAGQ
jgi:hypothetical protein